MQSCKPKTVLSYHYHHQHHQRHHIKVCLKYNKSEAMTDTAGVEDIWPQDLRLSAEQCCPWWEGTLDQEASLQPLGIGTFRASPKTHVPLPSCSF